MSEHQFDKNRHADQLATWCGYHGMIPPKGEVVDAFAAAMGDNQYGVEETWDAFCWFQHGFNAAGAKSVTSAEQEGYPGIAHDFESMRSLLERCRPAVAHDARLRERDTRSDKYAQSYQPELKEAAERAGKLLDDIDAILNPVGGERRGPSPASVLPTTSSADAQAGVTAGRDPQPTLHDKRVQEWDTDARLWKQTSAVLDKYEIADPKGWTQAQIRAIEDSPNVQRAFAGFTVGGWTEYALIKQVLVAAEMHASSEPDSDLCETCGLFKPGPDVQGDACPGHSRPTTLPENLRILAARLSEHLSPAEKRELEQAALALSATKDTKDTNG